MTSQRALVARYLRKAGRRVSRGGKNTTCQSCGGEGVAYRFEDRDPIEGYKLADKKTCLVCAGSGEVDVMTYYSSYEAHIQREATAREVKRRTAEIKKKVDKKTIEFIKKHM